MHELGECGAYPEDVLAGGVGSHGEVKGLLLEDLGLEHDGTGHALAEGRAVDAAERGAAVGGGEGTIGGGLESRSTADQRGAEERHTRHFRWPLFSMHEVRRRNLVPRFLWAVN